MGKGGVGCVVWNKGHGLAHRLQKPQLRWVVCWVRCASSALAVHAWRRVSWAAHALPCLPDVPTCACRRRLESCQEFDLDAALPALRQLACTFGRSFLLGGDLLHLPQLTRIELAAPLYDEVDWSVDLGVHSVPTLVELRISGRACLPRPESLRLSTLTRLTALTAAFHPAEAAEIGTLLRAAPPSLRSLKLLCFNWGCPGREQADLIDQLAPGIWSLTQLTSLAAVAQLALDLRAALPSLQQFTAVDLPPAMVTMEHAVGLWDLPSLRRLVLQPMEEDEALERDCLGLLRRALPAGWEVAVEAVEQEEENPFTGLDPLDFLED